LAQQVMMNETIKERGCHHYAYSQDLSTPDRFQLSELWESDDALAAHFRSDDMATYRTGIEQATSSKANSKSDTMRQTLWICSGIRTGIWHSA
jgi:quinol monooxygenase YgiN